MAVVHLRDASFSYGDRRVLDHVSLRLDPGERVAVIGANGAGKTTLLKVIGGLLHVGSGSVQIDGVDVAAIPRWRIARLVAAVPQELVIPFSFTVRDMVELGRTAYIGLFGGFTAVDRSAVDQALHVTDSTCLASRGVNELSGGERQRVLVAMALAQEPRILLLDEPTQRLDLTRQADILDVIRDVSAERGLTVLAAIHDLNLAGLYFDRLIVLSGGAIVADGAPREVMKAEVLEPAYAGRLRFMSVAGSATPIVLPEPKSLVAR
ncbi:MAG TPA: ABC transporter ATP-binding protein [Vicinamibacterales bacterium]|nr:ABC transporter ATP-binding protein [Vicinamibacterales bacterium]